ncbi:MAG: DUF6266 family protein [Bacteroidales bacterium]|nr:DUF6266 family protein [Bacteroidales bacterium]
MAIVNNLWLRGTKKRLAGTVVYQSMGQTIQRELAAQVTNPRTEAQMQQRVRWSNIVSLYRVLKPMMKYAYEGKKRTQSDYNAFMSANITNSPVALTKQEAAAGACVVAPYTITRGSLPAVSLSASNEGWVTDIFVGEFDDWAGATVGEFAKAVINGNPGIRRGDQISFIRLTQMVNGTTGIPYVILRKYEILMDPESNDLASNYLPVELLGFEGSPDNYKLEVINNGASGAFCIIISRTTSGRTMVSTQQLQIVNMDDMLAAYSSAEQIAGAIASYGESEDVFLSSTTAGYGQGQAVELSLLYGLVGNRPFMAGGYIGKAKSVRNDVLGGLFNAEVTITPSKVQVVTTESTIDASNIQLMGDKVSFTIPSAQTLTDTEVIKAFKIMIDGVTHEIKFSTVTQGLE